jgi:hypothetical protein
VSEALAAGVGSGSVVCAALVDGPVTGWLVVEEVAAAGAERQCAVVRLDGCAVVSAGALSEVSIVGGAVPTSEPMPAWASAIAGASWAARRARAEAHADRLALVEHKARLERIVDSAHEYADENNLCSRFDDFCEENGLRPRSHDYACVVDVTVRVRIPASGRNAEAASGEITEEMVAGAVAGLGARFLADAIQDHDVVDVARRLGHLLQFSELFDRQARAFLAVPTQEHRHPEHRLTKPGRAARNHRRHHVHRSRHRVPVIEIEEHQRLLVEPQVQPTGQTHQLHQLAADPLAQHPYRAAVLVEHQRHPLHRPVQRHP